MMSKTHAILSKAIGNQPAELEDSQVTFASGFTQKSPSIFYPAQPMKSQQVIWPLGGKDSMVFKYSGETPGVVLSYSGKSFQIQPAKRRFDNMHTYGQKAY